MQTRHLTYANEDEPRNRALSLHREYCITLAASFNGIFYNHSVIYCFLYQSDIVSVIFLTNKCFKYNLERLESIFAQLWKFINLMLSLSLLIFIFS